MAPYKIKITAGNKDLFLWTDDDGGLALSTIRSVFPEATNLVDTADNTFMRVSDGRVHNPEGWKPDSIYMAYVPASTTTPPANNKIDSEHQNEDPYVWKALEKFKKYMFYSLLHRSEDGSYVDGMIRNCITVATSHYAFMAGHCVPSGLPTGYEFTIYDSKDEPRIAKLVCLREADDFAILEVMRPFDSYPVSVLMPCIGENYFVLGYDGEYPNVYQLSCFSGTFRNTEIVAPRSYVIGSPGTTRGCSGGGVFSANGGFFGICVAGKIDTTSSYRTLYDHLSLLHVRLAEPSYSRIVPAIYMNAFLPAHRKRQHQDDDDATLSGVQRAMW